MNPLTVGQLNRTLLLRQGLLERARRSIPVSIERMGGIQNQYAPNGYIALWSRVAGFRREHLTSALLERRVIQATLMRGTIHLVSARDYHPIAAGVRRAQMDWWSGIARSRRLDDVSYPDVAAAVTELLSTGPLRRDQILEGLVGRGFRKEHWEGVSQYLDMVRVPPSGTWERRRADVYALGAAWMGANRASEEEGLELLIRRYLGGFGPAPIPDIATWARVPVAALEPVAERMRLRSFVDESGGSLVDLPGAPLADADIVAPPRFVPTWDAMLLVHARRTAVLPEEYRPIVFTSNNPPSLPTFIVDGRVAGWWRHEGDRIRVEPFAPISRRAMREVEEEAQGLAALHAR